MMEPFDETSAFSACGYEEACSKFQRAVGPAHQAYPVAALSRSRAPVYRYVRARSPWPARSLEAGKLLYQARTR